MSAYHTLHATVRVEVLPSDAGLPVEELFLKYRPELESALYDEDSREFSIVKLELVDPTPRGYTLTSDLLTEDRWTEDVRAGAIGGNL